MLTAGNIEHVLEAVPKRTIGVLGDLFLDRYLDIDASLTEPSLETGLDAYQVTRVRSYPGAAGTVINNLAALGVGHIVPISIIGDDGEGHELQLALRRTHGVDLSRLTVTTERRTPTYTKPMMCKPGEPTRELNRLDIKNRQPTSRELQVQVMVDLTEVWETLDLLLVLDQVSEAECGVVTTRIRNHLSDLGGMDPAGIVIVDSRERIGLFRNVWLKPNERECLKTVGSADDLRRAMQELMTRAQRPVICTRGEKGMLVGLTPSMDPTEVPAYPAPGPIDTVGAGDSSSAALACGLVCGLHINDAASFANLVASITIQQIGTTGTASPDQVRKRWNEVNA